MHSLPIEKILPEIRAILKQDNSLVVTAAPGSGKTTEIPLALLEESWLKGRRIVMLEPRRLAARSIASYMARRLSEKVGDTIGYSMRQDTKISAKTRIEIITEGVLLRKLHVDPALEDVGLVIFDEFHERSLHADLGLSLCLQSREILRPDLRMLVMSATMETEKVRKLIGGKVLEGSGEAYPVETIYLESRLTGDWLEALVGTINKAISEQLGDVLVFLPGAREIRRAEKELRQNRKNITIAPLYGALSAEEQEFALLPSRFGERKVVLATSIAETSLTVEGVRVVIDGGLMRVSRFSPRTGLTRLETIKVTLASANQRRGRAGRLEPGVCYRLWTKEEELRLTAENTPEIFAADLLTLALELAAWGVQDSAQLAWLDCPPMEAFTEAQCMLQKLGALDENKSITPHGKLMASMGIEPRLSHMILKAKELRLGSLACDLAALLEERDILHSRSADIRLRLEALRELKMHNKAFAADFDIAAGRRALLNSKKYQQMLGLEAAETYDIDICGQVLSLAYPDRIAAGKGEGRFVLPGGRGIKVLGSDSIGAASYLVVADLDDKGAESRVFLAAPISDFQLRQQFSNEILTKNVVWWDSESQMVRAICREEIYGIVLKEQMLTAPPAHEVTAALLQGIKLEGLNILPWNRKAMQLKERICFLHAIDENWPDVSDECLLSTLEDWLLPYIHGMKRRSELQQLSMESILLNLLSWEQRQKLSDYAPTHLVVPSGQRIPIDYSEPNRPVLAVRLQEMFGLSETPRIAGGKVGLVLHLLSPARRPVQVTQDLKGFWENTYFAVKKDLAGRYPKHYWPDNPLIAEPTHRVKPRK